MKRINESGCRQHGRGSVIVALLFGAIVLAGAPQIACGGDESAPAIIESSRFVAEIPVENVAAAPRLEFQIRPDMFDGGRWDLADLRLLDAADDVVPYAIQVRKASSSREKIAAAEFNRGVAPDGAAEVSLDLGEKPTDHNEIQVSTAGGEFRRQATLEGSTDGKAWNKLAEKTLLRFHRASGNLDDDRFEYSLSRFRYLRIRVSQDSPTDDKPVEITDVTVWRTEERPGEMVTFAGELGTREASRHAGVIGSWWPVDFGGTQVPCQQLEVEIENNEFVRNYTLSPLVDREYDEVKELSAYRPGRRIIVLAPVENTDGSGLGRAFSRFFVATGEWRRRAGEPLVPLVAEMGDVRVGRLRLFIEDSANQPLIVTSVKGVAPACVVVVAGSPPLRGPLRAYFGNALAEPPNYDFARNLPKKLDQPATRLVAGERTENAAYVPPPLPFTERYRWLIHCVLGFVSLVLAALVLQLARRVVARHDGQAAHRRGDIPQPISGA